MTHAEIAKRNERAKELRLAGAPVIDIAVELEMEERSIYKITRGLVPDRSRARVCRDLDRFLTAWDAADRGERVVVAQAFGYSSLNSAAVMANRARRKMRETSQCDA